MCPMFFLTALRYCVTIFVKVTPGKEEGCFEPAGGVILSGDSFRIRNFKKEELDEKNNFNRRIYRNAACSGNS